MVTISGTRSVMSSSVLVNTRTCSPSRWIWILMPSIFHSSAAGEIFSRAASRLGAEAASMGRTGWPTRSVKARSAAIDRSAVAVSGCAKRRLGDLGERSAQLVGPAHLRGRSAGRLGHRVGHDALERALPQVTSDQPDQELPLAVRGPPDQAREQFAPPGLRAWPCEGADLLERGVGLGQVQTADCGAVRLLLRNYLGEQRDVASARRLTGLGAGPDRATSPAGPSAPRTRLRSAAG